MTRTAWEHRDGRTRLTVDAMPDGSLHIAIDDPELWIQVHLPIAERLRLVRYLVGLRDVEETGNGNHRRGKRN